ncbi:MAG TPA: hypothetical protein VGZ73_08405 [Bryobacteraceae bacterium]|jgi:hypothetical protein|nr:hypothetical protein [Bryobacteraceae bacterium]
MTTHNTSQIAAVVLLILITGCGKDEPRPKVRGKVTYNGWPLADKTLILTLEAAEGVSQSLPLGPDGGFDGEVPEPGTYKVSIAESMAVMEGIDKQRKDRPKIAAKYRAAVTSDAKVTFDLGTNEKAIDLKD